MVFMFVVYLVGVSNTLCTALGDMAGMEVTCDTMGSMAQKA